jgi:PAP2 superfamily
MSGVRVTTPLDIGGFDPFHVRRLWRFVVALGVVAVVCLIGGHVYIFGDGWMSAALAATALVHASSRPTRRETLATLLLAAAFYARGGAAFDLGGLHPAFDRAVSALGLASLVVQVARLVRMPPADWTSERGGYAALAMLIPMFSLAFASSIALPGLIRSDVYDAIVLHFDRLLFRDHAPAFVIGRWLARHRWLAACAAFSYWAPQPLNVLLYLAERRKRAPRDLITTLLIAGIAGYAFYPFFPVIGPGYIFPGFPSGAGDIAFARAAVVAFPTNVPRNCMPSLHLAEALIVAVHAWRLGEGRWRVVGVVDVALTVLATLGFGKHYVADLLAALPFTYGVLGAARRDARAAAVGAGVTILFLLVLRFGFAP